MAVGEPPVKVLKRVETVGSCNKALAVVHLQDKSENRSKGSNVMILTVLGMGSNVDRFGVLDDVL